MRLSFLYAYRLIKQGKRFFLVALLNIALGLFGLFVLQNFKFSIEESVQNRVLSLMGSHLSLSSRTEILGEELRKIESELPKYERKETRSFYTMMQGPNGLRLVQVIAQDKGYPFYGGLELANGDRYPNKEFELGLREAFLSSDLRILLGVEKGDFFQIGEEKYLARDFVANDLSQSFGAFSLAPKVYVSLAGIENSNLIQKGSIVRRAYHYLFDEELAEPEIKRLEQLIETPGLRISSPQKNGDQVSRLLNYLNDFLGLCSLMAFTLVCIGLHYYYKSKTDRWRMEVALLKYLGVPQRKVLMAFSFFMALVAVGGVLLTIALGVIVHPIIHSFLAERFGDEFNLNLYAKTPFIILAIALIGNLSLAFPIILSVLGAKTSLVFNEQSTFLFSKRRILSYLPVMLFMWGMAIWLSHSVRTGSLFWGLILLVGFITSLLLFFILFMGSKFADRIGGHFKISLRYLRHFKVSTITIGTSLSLSVGLMILIPGLKKTIEEEITGDSADHRPSFFLFDIQDEQVEDLKTFLKENSYEMSAISPMIRSRIIAVNGTPFTRSIESGFSREEETRQRFRNRVVNLSYSREIPEGDQILDGEWFQGVFDPAMDERAELSIEKRYAKRLGMKLGDQVDFEVLGMPVKAKVTSIRRVKWTRFNPNFFLVFQPGVLEYAPKTWLASTGHLSEDERISFQQKMFKQFPNISLVDVEKIAERIFVIIRQMSIALMGMSVLSLLVALIVLGSLIYQQVLMRRNDLGLLKILGMTEKKINRLLVVECSLLAVIASGIGLVSGLALVFVFSSVMFGTNQLPITGEFFIIPIICISLSGLISYVVIQRIQRSPDFFRQLI